MRTLIQRRQSWFGMKKKIDCAISVLLIYCVCVLRARSGIKYAAAWSMPGLKFANAPPACCGLDLIRFAFFMQRHELIIALVRRPPTVAIRKFQHAERVSLCKAAEAEHD